MKKLILILLSFVVVLASSCTQEYICQCTVTYTGAQPGLPDSSVHEFAIKDKRKTASKLCEENSTQTTQNGVTTKDTCRLF